MQIEERSRAHRPVNRDFAVPCWFRVRFQLEQPVFLVILEIEMWRGKPLVDRLEVRAGRREADGSFSRADNGITTTNLRPLLVDRLVRAALESVRRPAGRGDWDPFADARPNIGARGRETPADRVMRAAEIYRQAVADRSAAPVKDVGIALGYSTSQASRYLKAARERGLLLAMPPQPEDARP